MYSLFMFMVGLGKIKDVACVRWFYSVPVLDEPVPAGGEQFAGLVWVPQRGDAHAVVGLPLLVELCRLPVPDVALAVRVARHQVTGTSEFRNSMTHHTLSKFI